MTVVVGFVGPDGGVMASDSEATTASVATLRTAARTYTDWSKSRLMSTFSGAPLRISGRRSRVAPTTARLEASECFRMVR